MINVNDNKVREVIQGIHEAMQQRKVKGESDSQREIIKENMIFSIICRDFDMGPTRVAMAMNDRYGYDMDADEVIRVFRNRRLANPIERKELFEWAQKVADYFVGAVTGKRESFDNFEKVRKEPAVKNRRIKSKEQGRIAVIMIYEKYPEIDAFDDMGSLYNLGNTLAKYFLYDISDAIAYAYGFPLYRDIKNKNKSMESTNKLSYEQALIRVEKLEHTLDRTNTMLKDLQDEFEEQLATSKVQELADFFAKLNSEKYGCILDELLVVRKGVDELRKNNYELPIEINGLLIMVKKLIQFVRDCHIEPVMKIDSIRDVIAADVEFCNYEGTPFITPDEKKTVKVVSPGWIYKDKELQISRPKVKEEN